jgi:hypothetical protein
LVAVPARSWRPIVWPLAFLLAATIAIGLIRATRDHHHAAAPPAKAHHAAVTKVPKQHQTFYVVHAGDTLSSIAAKKHVSLGTLRHLNPNVQPTALYLGEKLRLH